MNCLIRFADRNGQDIPVYSLLQNSKAGHPLLEIVRAGGGTTYVDPGFLIPHRKDYYLLVFVKQGDSRHWVDFAPYTLQPDTFYFTTPDQVHLKEEMKPMDGYIVRFTHDFLLLEENRALAALPVILNSAAAHILRLTPADILFCEALLPRLLTEFSGDDPFRSHMLSALLQELLVYLSRLYQQQYKEELSLASPNGSGISPGSRISPNGPGAAPPRALLREFQSLINEHHRELHDVASYAGLLHLTPDYLNDLVRQQSGKTALSHIHQRIVVEAKRLLLHTELSIKEIAEQMGFADAAYFNRFFKRMVSATPVEYRTKIREMYR